jgi:hypothetical protein
VSVSVCVCVHVHAHLLVCILTQWHRLVRNQMTRAGTQALLDALCDTPTLHNITYAHSQHECVFICVFVCMYVYMCACAHLRAGSVTQAGPR